MPDTAVKVTGKRSGVVGCFLPSCGSGCGTWVIRFFGKSLYLVSVRYECIVETEMTRAIVLTANYTEILRFHVTPVRIGIIWTTNYTKCCGEFMENETLIDCWWRCYLVHSLWKSIWRILTNLKIGPNTIYDSFLTFFWVLPRELISWNDRDSAYPYSFQNYSQ